MCQCEETEEGLHPPETTLSGEHDAQTLAESLEELRKDIPLMMESSGSESDSCCDWMSEFRTGNKKAFDSGYSSKSDMSKAEPIVFKRRERMSAQSGDSSDSDWSEGTCPPLSRSVGSDSEVSYKDDGSDDNLWSPLRVLLRPIGSSCVSVLSDCSERQRSHSFPQRRRRCKSF